MQITNNFAAISTMVFAMGLTLILLGLVATAIAWNLDNTNNHGIRGLLSIAAVGVVVSVSGLGWNSTNANDLNKQFASKLQDQYGAYSDKSYTDLFQSRDKITTLTKGDDKKQVKVIFESDGNIKFTDVSSDPYQ